jgi:hypothetical protein
MLDRRCAFRNRTNSRPKSPISNRKGRKVRKGRKGRPNQGNDQEQTKQRTFGLYPNPRFPLRSWRSLRLDTGATYGNRRLWITFLRRFWGVFLGGFWDATGPGARVRGVFSAEGVLLVRWASANFDFFRGFFLFLARFLPVFVPYFALFPSMSWAYLYVNNFFPVSLAWELHSLHRRDRRGRRERRESGEKARRQTAQPSTQPRRGPTTNKDPEGPFLTWGGR